MILVKYFLQFCHVFHTKIVKIVAIRNVLVAKNSVTCVCGRGSAPDLARGAYDAPTDPLVGWGWGGGIPSPFPTPDAFDVWMKANRLCLNAQKTQLIWLGSGQQLKITVTDVQLLSANLQVMSTVRNYLGVVIDSRLTMADHITAVCRSGYYQLRQLRCVVQSLT